MSVRWSVTPSLGRVLGAPYAGNLVLFSILIAPNFRKVQRHNQPNTTTKYRLTFIIRKLLRKISYQISHLFLIREFDKKALSPKLFRRRVGAGNPVDVSFGGGD